MNTPSDTIEQQAASALTIEVEPNTPDMFRERIEAAFAALSNFSGVIEIPQRVTQAQAIRISLRGTESVLLAYQADIHPESVTVETETDSTDTLAEEFHTLVNRWHNETFHLSSLTKIYAHPAYLRIMAMGTRGLPLVLQELQKNQGHWFYALKFMAGINVSAGIDDYEGARAAWLEWGYKNNYI